MRLASHRDAGETMREALAIADRDQGLTPLGYALPPNGPVPALTKRIVELLRVERGDLVVDLCGPDFLPAVTVLDDVRRRNQFLGARPFGEHLARLLATSGVRTVQMDARVFQHLPMRYGKVLLRGGFARFRDRFREELAPLFEKLDPLARLLVVDSAPSADAPLFAAGLRLWEREYCPAEVIARIANEAGFATRVDVVTCVRRVSAADCRTWITSRGWPVLASFSKAELEGGLDQLQPRLGSRQTIAFTSRFELVLATKAGAVADPRERSAG
jgi:hypothetical protein